MKKYITSLACIAIIGFAANSTTAADNVDVVQSVAGGPVTIAVSITGAPDVTFNPSTNVNMNGKTAPNAFQISGYHDAANVKANGQAYGMASDVNKLFWLDISTTAYVEPTGTNSTAFGSWNTL